MTPIANSLYSNWMLQSWEWFFLNIYNTHRLNKRNNLVLGSLITYVKKIDEVKKYTIEPYKVVKKFQNYWQRLYIGMEHSPVTESSMRALSDLWALAHAFNGAHSG